MKKLLPLVLAALLVCGMFVAGASADTSGDYEFDRKTDNTVVITGADSALKDGNIPAELSGHQVSAIADDALFNMTNLTDVVIPEGVTTLGRYVLYRCPKLKSVTIPASVTEIGEGSFAKCDKVPAILVAADNPVFTVNNKALINTQEMVLLKYTDSKPGDYEVGWGIRRIGVGAFTGSKLKSVTLPASVTEIGGQAFAYCSGLQAVNLPETVTSIDVQAFSFCSQLKSITIPNSVTYIGEGIFNWSPALKTVQIAPDHPVFEMNGPFLVNKAEKMIACCLNSAKGKCEIPDGIEKIEYLAFVGCSGLKEITIPASVTDIPVEAFRDCKNLVIKAPAGSYAQKYCESNKIKFAELK